MFGKDFNTDKDTLRATINAIVIPENLEGFIFSFYNHYHATLGILDPTIKKPLGYITLAESSLSRYVAFNLEENDITPDDTDIKMINNYYFEHELQKVYKNINMELFEFHWSYRKHTDDIMLFYDELLNKFSEKFFNAYNTGKITNLGKLQMNEFKDKTYYEYNNTKDLILFLRFSLTKNNPYTTKSQIWYNYFKSESIFNKFVKYISEENIVEPLADISYLYQRMKYDGYLEQNISHIPFADWLLKNEFITKGIHDKIINNGGFRSLDKSASSERINKYNRYFKD